ncbi:WW domain-containing oxidoreductase-like [Tigriopus californicus]|uniref:WW domain-containing oxidoreductase-like n=1 Tax=Tigriopus californicus TaxID=6832 RepID=UPI0027DA95EE|nr:WW domain-containing oxidoreductase-like [Tigriopus californicus]
MSTFQPETDSEDELPPQWEEKATVDGKVFFINHANQSTHWNHPRTGRTKSVSKSLPFGWERQIMNDGKVMYVDHEGQKTSFTDPRLAFAQEDSDETAEFRQKYDASTRAMEIVHVLDLSAIVTVITGANSGIGFETARTLAFRGANVVLACRSMAKAKKAVEKIAQVRPSASLHPFQMDLQSLRSVKECAQKICACFEKIHVLILNAGILDWKFELTMEDQMEKMIQVNYFAQVYLAHLLKDRMAQTSNPRIVWLSAESHRFAPLQSDGLTKSGLLGTSEAKFIPIDAYNNSKVLGMAFAIEADRQWRYPWGIQSFPVHPGNMVFTNLMRNSFMFRLLFLLVSPFAKSLEQAASSVVFAGFAPDMAHSGGTYINNCFPCEPGALPRSDLARSKIWILTKDILQEKLRDIDPDFSRRPL